MMRWRVVTPPPAIVTLVEARAHLRVDVSDEDALIVNLVAAATRHIEHVMSASIATQTIEARLAAWPARTMRLPRPPVASVIWIRYVNEDGEEVEVPASDYSVIDVGVYAKTAWPSAALSDALADPIAVRYVAGSAVEDVPADIKHAVLLLVGHWYEHREAAVTGTLTRNIALGVDALIAPHRRWS